MPRFFIEPGITGEGDKKVITGEDARHISYSLRSKVGDEYTLCDTDNYEYRCVIENIDAESVTLRVLEKSLCKAEPTVEVVLYQALVKGDKFDTVVQKAVELGISEIVPVISERCVSRPDEKSLEKKTERWRKIAKNAAMQCARSHIPNIRSAVDFVTAADEISRFDCGFICYEAEPHEPMKKIFDSKSREKDIKSYGFFIGPEGGISKSEAEYAERLGIPLASLGKRILRTETAPLCVISSIMFYSDNLN